MFVAYVDDAGDVQVPTSAGANIQPILAFGGLIVDLEHVPALTRHFLAIKQHFLGRRRGRHALDAMLVEVKGAELRTLVRDGHRQRRRALGFLQQTLELLERYDARLMARLWMKTIGAPLDGRAINTFSIQSLCETYQNFLEDAGDLGTTIIDSSTPGLNARVSHSIFTQRFRQAGDPYNRLVELPTFGHSDNHAGLQIADVITSGLLVPIAARTYCTGHYTGTHVHSRYEELKRLFASRLGARQHRYRDTAGRWRGGFMVSDPLGSRHSGHLIHTSCDHSPGGRCVR